MEPKFTKGGKLEKWNPIFESFTTLAFTPAHVTSKGSHIRDGVDLKRTMMTVILAMIPCLLFGIYNAGHWEMVAATGDRGLEFWANGGAKFIAGLAIVLPIIVVSYGVGLTIEFIFGMKNVSYLLGTLANQESTEEYGVSSLFQLSFISRPQICACCRSHTK